MIIKYQLSDWTYRSYPKGKYVPDVSVNGNNGMSTSEIQEFYEILKTII